MIRLKEQQQYTIKRLAWEIFNSSKVMIFGSRADMSQKGGDIDIYIQTDKKEGILKLKLTFLREFAKLFGEIY